MPEPATVRWHDTLVQVLRTTQQAEQDALPELINAAVARVGIEITVFLVDHEQRRLHPLPQPGRPVPPPVAVEANLAGRAFTTVQVIRSTPDGGPRRILVPLIDGSERLGVVDILITDDQPITTELVEHCRTLTALIGHLITAKLPYGDTLPQVRRSRPMTPGGELLSTMLPPLTFTCDGLVISAILEPTYDMGGDAFDYAVDNRIARLLIIDAMGRGLTAGLTAAVALAAIRSTRRAGHDLAGMARAVDAALVAEFSDMRYVTGVLAELDLADGRLRYLNAGHPPPLLLRKGRAVRTLIGGRRLPMGLGEREVQIGEEALEPGDTLLLHTDGVTESRAPDGTPFGTARLVNLAERHAASGLPAPETLRRLAHHVVDYAGGRPRDDASLLLAEWSATASERMAY